RILLVEDIAGRGTTLHDCLTFLRRHGAKITVFALAYDDESRITPDYGVRMPPGYRAWFPWERESITDAFAQTGNLPDQPEYAYAQWAIDLDGVLCADIHENDYLNDLDDALRRRDALPPSQQFPHPDVYHLPIITGRPEKDRARTRAWLDQHGFRGPLIMR